MLPQHIWLSCSIVRRCVKPQLIPCFAFLRNTVSYAEHVLSYVRLALRIANCLARCAATCRECAQHCRGMINMKL